jgi:hypothetical protein
VSSCVCLRQCQQLLWAADVDWGTKMNRCSKRAVIRTGTPRLGPDRGMRGDRQFESGGSSAAPRCSNQTGLRLTLTDLFDGPDLPERPSPTSVRLVCIQTVWPVWPLSGRQRALNAAAYCATVSTVSPGQHRNGQVAGARDTVYGSEGAPILLPVRGARRAGMEGR